MAMYILCPYFKRERKKSISCEDTIRSFYKPGEKSMMLRTYCSADWKKCPFAERMNRIYNQDEPYSIIKENIMKNKIEQQSEEIKKLMRRNGQLERELKVLKEQIEDRDRVATKNHEMYVKSLKAKDSLLEAKNKNIEWLESFAAAFLAVAYGDNTREIRMSQSKILKLMTAYTMTYNYDAETDAWVFNINKNIDGKES